MNDLGKNSVYRLRIDSEQEDQRLDNFLMTRLKGVPKSRIYKLVRGGEVRINGGRVEASYRLKAGDELRIPPVRVATPAETPVLRLPPGVNKLVPRIIYRDESLIALNKPPGMAVHGGSGISRGVIEQMRLELPECRYMELVHRLDRETSGVLLIALKRRALVGMHEAMRQGKIEKRYLTLVSGRWREEVRNVRLPLHKRITDDGEKRVTVRDDGQSAHTIFRRIQTWPEFTLLEAELKTGRTHQIRVHASHLGFPIAGDDKYGDFALNKSLLAQGLKRMFLHAAKLVFMHPITGERMEVAAPLPADLQVFLDYLNAQTV
jgi:23S rRNA pseudouridine955/2504/2580 synthase